MNKSTNPIQIILYSLLLFSLSLLSQPLIVKNLENITKRKIIQKKTICIKQGDTIFSLLQHVGISYNTVQDLLKVPQGNQLTKIKPGSFIVVKWIDSKLQEVRYYSTPLTCSLFAYTDKKHFVYRKIELTPATRLIKKNITIENSLFVSGKKVGLDDKVLLDLMKIFDSCINFAFDLRRNDFFSIVYEEYYIKNKKVATGSILAARFKSKGRTLNAVRYVTKNGQSGYYSTDGQSLEPGFLRTPVEYSHISSGFTDKRLHPVFGIIKPHRAIDYAAPMNTPVKVTGNGTISFIGYQRGYGKVIFVSHSHKITTVYAHLNRYGAQLKQGMHVKRGDIIGYVGMTGSATGPHLHYEFRINGVQKNPLTIKLPYAEKISTQEMPSFLNHSQLLLTKLTGESAGQFALNEQTRQYSTDKKT